VADAVIIATGAVARRLPFKGSDEDNGFWNKAISAWAVRHCLASFKEMLAWVQ